MSEGSPQPTGSPRPRLDAGRLWAGGAAAGLVAAGVALVGFLIARGVLEIDVLAPNAKDRIFDSAMVWYAVVAFVATLIATALAHLLILSTPEPLRFFSWIIGLATVVAALLPFLGDADLGPKIVTGLINLAIGLTILSIVGRIARTSYTYAIA